MASHVAGERFVLIDAGRLKVLNAPAAAIGTVARIAGVGTGDATAATADAKVTGRALRPPSPVHLRADRLVDGSVRISWTRRSRLGWSWLDGADAPLGEEAERYRLTIDRGSGPLRTIELSAPQHDYRPAEQLSDGASGAIDIAVVQIGAVAASDPPARLRYTL